MSDETEQIKRILEKNQEMLKEMKTSVEKMQSYLFWAFIAVIVSVIVPLIGMVFVIPMFINRYTGLL
jgi:type II secretory pathway component PulF